MVSHSLDQQLSGESRLFSTYYLIDNSIHMPDVIVERFSYGAFLMMGDGTYDDEETRVRVTLPGIEQPCFAHTRDVLLVHCNSTMPSFDLRDLPGYQILFMFLEEIDVRFHLPRFSCTDAWLVTRRFEKSEAACWCRRP